MTAIWGLCSHAILPSLVNLALTVVFFNYISIAAMCLVNRKHGRMLIMNEKTCVTLPKGTLCDD